MRTRIRLVPVAAMILFGAVLTACDDDHSGPIGQPAPVGPLHTVTPTGPLTGTDGGHLAAAKRGNLRTADFELASGVTTLVVHSADIGDDLYHITTPTGAGVVPTAVVSVDHVVAQLSNSGVTGPSIVDVALSSAVAWTIHLDGGATSTNVDMRAGGLAMLDFGAGVTRIEAALPKVDGVLAVKMSGGATDFTVHAPNGVPTKVTMGGGGSTATLDGTAHHGIAGGTVYSPDGWSTAGQRIDIDNTAGVNTFTLDRY